jgi:hypothetical protein
MSKIFISYCHESEAIVGTLAEDIEELGHEAWFDHGLSGGQAWWDQILGNIRKCDVFVFVLVPEALSSTACTREYNYAADLGKPILPIMVAEEVSANLLPPSLSKIQYVDYRKRDRDSALHLARAFSKVPPPEPLPEPLPDPPEVPLSYLGGLTEQIGAKVTLSYEEQSALVVDLKTSLRDPETAKDARTLLERLRKRRDLLARDLLASIAAEIDEALASSIKAQSTESEPDVTQNVEETSVETRTETETEPPAVQPTQPPTTEPVPTPGDHKITRRERLKSALYGAIIGFAIGVGAVVTPGSEGWWIGGFIAGTGGAIAGAISGAHRRLIVAVILGAALGWIIVSMSMWDDRELFLYGGVFGAPSGAILGAIAGVILRKWKKWP